MNTNNFSFDIIEPLKIIHCENSLTISDFIYYQEDAMNGNPYNTTFNIQVVSGAFTGIGCCEYDIKNFVKFAHEINELYEFKRSTTKLEDICYGSHVDFNMSKAGHLEVCGIIYGHAMIHSMNFEFFADQSSLKPFVDSIKQIYIKEIFT